MARLVQLRSTCDHGNVCPTLHYRPDTDEYVVQGYTVTDPQVVAALNLAVGETVVQVPTGLLPELQRDVDPGFLLVRGWEVNDVALLAELAMPAPLSTQGRTSGSSIWPPLPALAS